MSSPSSPSTPRRRRHRHTSPPRKSPFPIKQTTCPICFDRIDHHHHRTAAVIAACNHAYCLACLITWINIKPICPLCNTSFDSYLTWTGSEPSRTVTWHRIGKTKTPTTGIERGRIGVSVQRLIRRTREERSRMSARSRPVPRRRSFRCGRDLSLDVVRDRVLSWRESIYRQGLQAVPFSNRSHLQLVANKQSVPISKVAKDRILQRIEPWIWRELQAILKDPDPTIIVRVVSSLFISSIERRKEGSAGNRNTQEDFLAPLRRFLHGWTDMFWHELRCFEESSFTIETYDATVEYRRFR